MGYAPATTDFQIEGDKTREAAPPAYETENESLILPGEEAPKKAKRPLPSVFVASREKGGKPSETFGGGDEKKKDQKAANNAPTPLS